MQKGLCILLTLSCLLFLASCSTLQNLSECTQDYFYGTTLHTSAKALYPKTDSNSITVISHKNLNTSYKTIGIISVKRCNFVGVKRQTARIKDIMRDHAARIGGNAIVNYHIHQEKAIGEIVRFT